MNGHQIASGARREADSFLAAVMFLTRIPVGSLPQFRADQLARSAVYFPLIGMAVGAAGALVVLAAQPFFPPLIAALLCMLATVLITGGLHEDGLSDAADGLMGGHDPARRLEIMKDSGVGTYGALALWFSLTAKLLLLHALLGQSAWLACGALVAAHTLGRGATVALLYACPYARSEESKSKPFGDRVTLGPLLLALSLSIAVAVALLGARAVACLAIAAVITWATGVYCRRKIGGITGDCLGAVNQLVELACYLVLVSWL
ncbi:MAG: adenosylcobinamide-GDP ribazoletransferase [Verrucomicrobiota bacterium]|nr:adenosylcobinamide-GDP ribazoletransferase [Verrucomicrobiota bacterium]